MKKQRVTLEYDRDADAAYLALGRSKVASSEEVEPGLVVDFDTQNQVVGVEILYFRRRFGAKSQSRPHRKSVAV